MVTQCGIWDYLQFHKDRQVAFILMYLFHHLFRGGRTMLLKRFRNVNSSNFHNYYTTVTSGKAIGRSLPVNRNPFKEFYFYPIAASIKTVVFISNTSTYGIDKSGLAPDKWSSVAHVLVSQGNLFSRFVSDTLQTEYNINFPDCQSPLVWEFHFTNMSKNFCKGTESFWFLQHLCEKDQVYRTFAEYNPARRHPPTRIGSPMMPTFR